VEPRKEEEEEEEENGVMRKATKFWPETPKEHSTLETQDGRMLKWVLKETGCGDIYWIQQDQDRT
jgi:hypothetical protein